MSENRSSSDFFARFASDELNEASGRRFFVSVKKLFKEIKDKHYLLPVVFEVLPSPSLLALVREYLN